MGPSEVVSCGSLGAPPHVGIPSNVHSVACIQLLAPCWNGGATWMSRRFIGGSGMGVVGEWGSQYWGVPGISLDFLEDGQLLLFRTMCEENSEVV